jgi:hypothetical protein
MKVDVNGWLEAFAAHPAIGTISPSVSKLVFLSRTSVGLTRFSSLLAVADLQSLQAVQGGAIGSDFHSH